MTLQCWMHWFWITLWTVIAVLPNSAFGLPVPLAVGDSSVDVSSILHQFPSVHNAVRQTKSLPPTALPEKIVEPPETAKTPPEQNAKPRNLLDVQNNNSLIAENQRALAENKEQVKRNKVPVEKTAPAVSEIGASFPVPQVDDSGDGEGGVPLQVAEAAVGLKPPEQPITRASVTSPASKELDLRYNAVIADSTSTLKPTEQPACNDCITTITSQQQGEQQKSAEETENTTQLDPVIAEDTSNTEISIDTNVENITGFTEANLIQEENTEGILSRSSLAVLETRDHPTGKMLSQASSGEIDDQNGMDPGAIAGISLGVLAIATLAAAASFVLYRTRYLNNPQTLSDKCSNPDSSGYIDDSTMRENSEEMYSLDNDSFLNSLEAMTIQNYWTDSVKHTKL